MLDISVRWGTPTLAGIVKKDGGTSLQTGLRGQPLNMRAQHMECVRDEEELWVQVNGDYRSLGRSVGVVTMT